MKLQSVGPSEILGDAFWRLSVGTEIVCAIFIPALELKFEQKTLTVFFRHGWALRLTSHDILSTRAFWGVSKRCESVCFDNEIIFSGSQHLGHAKGR